ncbi:MAG: hypothetical protein HND58_03750 [Planctomycetota bacterium]|nr:MAG: hypothetical protein HND58_03750 [Planctomycetota bacterium]
MPEALAAVEEPRDEPPVDTGGRLSDFDVRFVGSITSGGRAAAFVNIAGVTKVLRPGESYEGVQLVEVVGDEIAVSIDGGEEEMIGKSERKGSAVSVVIGGAPAAPANTPNSAVAGDEPNQISPDMSREERRAALMERAQRSRSLGAATGATTAGRRTKRRAPCRPTGEPRSTMNPTDVYRSEEPSR